MDKLPLVSFIIPCYNQAKFLHECIASIETSYSGPKEIWVVDDCSPNPTTSRKLAEVQRTFPAVKISRNEKHLGVSATRNKALDASAGEFIQFVDGDDLLFPRKVDLQLVHLAYGNHLDISLCDYVYCNETISNFYLPDIDFGAYELSLEDFLFKWERGLSIPIHSGLFRRDVLSNMRFEESLTGKEDWVFWCILAAQHHRMSFLNLCGAAYRQYKTSMTKHKVDEMGRMWLKASLLMDDLLGHDPRFIASSLSWYKAQYENADPQLNGKMSEEKSRQGDPLPASALQACHPFHQSEKKLLSVLVPVYNHYEYLHKCFQSLLDQTFADFEIICIDDDSPDGRVGEFLDTLEKNFPQVKVLHNENNAGIVASFNRGVEVARGDFIAFLDCDDYLPSNALEVVARSLQKQPGIDYFFSDKIDVDENDHTIRKAVYGGYPHIHPSGDIENDLLDGMIANHLKVIRKAKILEVGGFNPALDGVQDFDLALRLIRLGTFKYLDQPLYYHRQHTHSVTQADTISQFRKQNIARRAFTDKWFPKHNSGEALIVDQSKEIPYPMNSLEDNHLMVYTPDHYPLPDIKTHVKAGFTCIFDARKASIGKWSYFLWDYNSFFDLILTDDPKLAVFLIGYLWDYRILKLVSPACPAGVITHPVQEGEVADL